MENLECNGFERGNGCLFLSGRGRGHGVMSTDWFVWLDSEGFESVYVSERSRSQPNQREEQIIKPKLMWDFVYSGKGE